MFNGPEDAVRESKDIPCAFGSFCVIREGELVSITIMRSNNALILLPYNAFEFTLFAEIIATAAGVKLGPYIHFAASMHVFEGDRKAAGEVVEAYRSSVQGRQRHPMPPMPAKPGPLSQIDQLVRLEADLRHDQHALAKDSADKLLSRGSDELKAYWLDFYRVLLAHALSKVGRHDAAAQVADKLPPYFQTSVVQQLQRAAKVESGKGDAAGLPLFPEPPAISDAASSARHAIAAAFAPGVDEERRARDELHAICKSLEAKQGRDVLRTEFEELERRLIRERPLSLAARSEPGVPGSHSDRAKLVPEEVEKVLSEIRRSLAK